MASALAHRAEVAELVDALGSGPSGVKTLWRFESSSRHRAGFFYNNNNKMPTPITPTPAAPDAAADARRLARARHNMVEQQIRPWEVLDERVLALYEEPQLWREHFVFDAARRHLAYADLMLPFGDAAAGEAMLEPKLEARMLQTLDLSADDVVLHIGCGSGFFAALLGRLCRRVYSVESNPQVAEAARARLQSRANNVEVVCGCGMAGLPERAPFDAIALTGATPTPPAALFEQLRVGGKLLAVVGEAPAMRLRLHWRPASGSAQWQDILETQLPRLSNAAQSSSFVF